MPRPIRRTALPATLAALALASVAAGTATANPYPIGSSTPIAGLGAAVNYVGNGAYRTDVNAGSPVGVGYKFQAAFGCSRAGTHLESIQFQAVRNSQLNSSMELRVLSNGARAFGVADSDIPIGGAGKQYNIPVSTCSAAVELNQVEARSTPARVYHLGGLTAVERDDTAPDLGIRSITTGWITGNGARVNWGTYDNYGALGIENQRVSVAGGLRWQGYPEDGEHGVDIALDGLPDGAHTVTVEVDGSGTAGATQTGTLWIDRTPPTVSLKVTRLGPWKVRIEPVAADATSRIASWAVKAGDRVLSSEANNVAEIDLHQIQPAGGAFSATIQAYDVAGHLSTATSNTVNISPLEPKATTAPHIVGRAVRGQQLTGSPGVWSDPAGAQVTTKLQWQRCALNGGGCLDIPGATETTYTLDDPDLGRTLRVAVTGTGAEGAATVASAPTAPISQSYQPAPANPGAPPAASPVASPREPDRFAKFEGIVASNLVVKRSRPVARDGKTLPLVRVLSGGAVTATAAFRRDGVGVPNVPIELLDSVGDVAARGMTDAAGNITLTAPVKGGSGRWAFAFDGRYRQALPFLVNVRAKVSGILRRYDVPAFGELVVPGRLIPGRLSSRKLVQLQVLLRGRWTSRAQTTSDETGHFVLRYKFVLGGGYTVPMRIVTPRERGWDFAPAQSHRFDVVVRP
jgi:hypothetical protein